MENDLYIEERDPEELQRFTKVNKIIDLEEHKSKIEGK